MLTRLAALTLVLTLFFVSGRAAVAGNINDPNVAGPLPDNYALAMIAWFQADLKDPYSAQVAWMRPSDAYADRATHATRSAAWGSRCRAALGAPRLAPR